MYNMTSVDLKTFTFSFGSISRSIDKAVLGPLPKRLLFTKILSIDFNGSLAKTPTNLEIMISVNFHCM